MDTIGRNHNDRAVVHLKIVAKEMVEKDLRHVIQVEVDLHRKIDLIQRKINIYRGHKMDIKVRK